MLVYGGPVYPFSLQLVSDHINGQASGGHDTGQVASQGLLPQAEEALRLVFVDPARARVAAGAVGVDARRERDAAAESTADRLPRPARPSGCIRLGAHRS